MNFEISGNVKYITHVIFCVFRECNITYYFLVAVVVVCFFSIVYVNIFRSVCCGVCLWIATPDLIELWFRFGLYPVNCLYVFCQLPILFVSVVFQVYLK